MGLSLAGAVLVPLLGRRSAADPAPRAEPASSGDQGKSRRGVSEP
jgi:hypothetical protein